MPALTWDDFAKVDCADPREAVTTIWRRRHDASGASV